MTLLKNIKSIIISGKECLPIIEGGKGINISTGTTAGHFAKAGAVGTFSGVNPDAFDENGKIIPRIFAAKTRVERQIEMIEHSIKGILSQAKIAYDISGGKGRIHMNILWEMGGAEKVLHGALEKAKGLIHGVTCGAGMPYKLAEISAKYKVYYYPIVSSMRAFRALWKRGFSNFSEWLGGVVYECPWRAGGHNGLSNTEDPNVFGDSYTRVKELRKFMNEIGLKNTPIIVAGGVWNLEEYEHWLDNPEIGPVAFQFGTRPMMTTESPISDEIKQKLFSLKEGDIMTNKFSPTGFYSSAVKNKFMKDLVERSQRQVECRIKKDDVFNTTIIGGSASNKKYYIKEKDKNKVNKWIKDGQTEALRTPDNTIVFVTHEKAKEFKQDQRDCIGCLSQCQFSSWSQYMPENNYCTGKIPDHRSFCIQKTLQRIGHGESAENNLLFSGSNGYRFATDPFYKDGFIPTTQRLIDRIMEGK